MLSNCGAGEDSRIFWNARRSIQSVLKEINLKCWSWSSNTLATWCKEPTLEKTLTLGKIERKRRRGQQRMRSLDSINWLSGHEFEQTPGESEGQGSLACCSPWGHRVRYGLATELNWTWLFCQFLISHSLMLYCQCIHTKNHYFFWRIDHFVSI